jgi:hypothetical protein
VHRSRLSAEPAVSAGATAVSSVNRVKDGKKQDSYQQTVGWFSFQLELRKAAKVIGQQCITAVTSALQPFATQGASVCAHSSECASSHPLRTLRVEIACFFQAVCSEKRRRHQRPLFRLRKE